MSNDGIKVDDIKNITLKALAMHADKNRNGILDSEEVSVFDDKAAPLIGQNEERDAEYVKIMGLYRDAGSSQENKSVTPKEEDAIPHGVIVPHSVPKPNEEDAIPHGVIVPHSVPKPEEEKDAETKPEVFVSGNKIFRNDTDVQKAIKNGKIKPGDTGYYVINNKGGFSEVQWNEGNPEYKEFTGKLRIENPGIEPTKGQMKFVGKELEGAINRGDINNINELKQYLAAHFDGNDDGYKTVASMVDKYVELAQSMPHGSRREIESLKLAIKDSMLKDGWGRASDSENINSTIHAPVDMLDKTSEKVLDMVVATVESLEVEKEYQEIAEMFKNVGVDKDGNKTPEANFSKRAETVKAQLKEKGLWKDSYYKKAFQMYVDKAISQEMTYQIEGDIKSLYGGENANSGKLPVKNKEIRAQLEAKHAERLKDGGKDDLYEDAVDDSETLIDITRRHNIVYNRRKELSNISKEDLENKLCSFWRGEESLDDSDLGHALNKYMNEHKVGDNYDLSGISKAIESRAGYDYLVNNGSKEQNKVISELEAIRGWVEHETGATNLSDDDVKALIKLCGFEIEEKDHTPKIVKAGGDILKHLAAGGAGALVSELTTKLTIPVVTNDVTIDINVLQSVVGTITQDGVDLDIQNLANTIVTVEDRIEQINIAKELRDCALKGLGTMAGAEILLSLANDIILGNDVAFEKACVNPNDYDIDDPDNTYTNKDKYVEYMQKHHPEIYARIQADLAKFPADEDGNWNHEEFFNMLRREGGFNITNCEERYGFKIFGDIKVNDIPPRKDKESVVRITSEQDNEVVIIPGTNDTVVEEDDCIMYNVAGSDPTTYTSVYANLADENHFKSTARAIRAVKIVQGITDGNYSFERLKKLVELSYNPTGKNLEALKNEPGFNWDIAHKHIKTAQYEVKLPKEIAGCVRPDIECGQDSKKTPDALKTTRKYTKKPGQKAPKQYKPAKGKTVIPGRQSETRENCGTVYYVEVKEPGKAPVRKKYRSAAWGSDEAARHAAHAEADKYPNATVKKIPDKDLNEIRKDSKDVKPE